MRTLRSAWGLRGSLILAALSLRLACGADVTIQLTALSGLKFDPARFVVEPGARVTIVFTNPDDMMHNVVIVQPGARLAVVEAALALGEQGPARNFHPDSDRILAAMPIVNPGRSDRLTFTAPATEGVYPYVCTFPGHGLVMYGAMYVAREAKLPPLAQDPNVPPPVAATTVAALTRTTLQRTFLPDCGPAAIAVGLPGGQAYCFDATQCRLRYAWRGGFVDNATQLLGKGDQFAAVAGRVYYRARAEARLRVGDAGRPAIVKWLGTRNLAGKPSLHYTLDGADVTEIPGATADGQQLEITYEISDAKAPVTFVADPDAGATITASAGQWSAGRLILTPAEARHFIFTFKERPGVEPLAYWSMNDLPFAGRKDPAPGVVGRAFTPGGNMNRWEVLDTGIKLGALAHAGTLMSWVKLAPPPAAARNVKVTPTAPVFSAGEDENAFRIAAEGLLLRWQHLAAVLHHGMMTLYVDGKEVGARPASVAEVDATVRIGSLGKKEFLSGLLDEVRIYDRPLAPAEIAAIYQREKPKETDRASSQ